MSVVRYQKKPMEVVIKRQKRRKKKSNKPLLGNKFSTVLKYWSIFTTTPSSGLLAGNVLTANGLFDPDITGSGHQPRGFDQLMPLYDHYAVKKATVVAKFSNDASNDPVMCFVIVRDKSTPIASGTDAGEHRHVKYGWCTRDNPLTISYTVDIAQFLGRKNVMCEDDLHGTASTNPTEQVYFQLLVGDVQGATFTSPVSCAYTVYYHTALIEPKQPTIS